MEELQLSWDSAFRVYAHNYRLSNWLVSHKLFIGSNNLPISAGITKFWSLGQEVHL